MAVLSARCSGSDEIPLDRAEQSSVYAGAANREAAHAIDGDFKTEATTKSEANPWLMIYFRRSVVEKVVVEKGYTPFKSCEWTVSVFDGDVKTVCGTYTNKYA